MDVRKMAMCLMVSALGCGPASAGIVWSDEFNGDMIDAGTWVYDVGGGGFGNGQFEYDTARHENSYLTNGNLVIEARRESYFGNAFTSARMLTQGRFAFKYGTLEARIKLPNTANGLWPAFWMLGNNIPGIAWPGAGELDIVEMGSKAGITQGLQREKINCALHYSDASGTHGMVDAWTNAPVDLTLDYHRYKMSWTPTDITFYLDDIPYGSWDITADYLGEFHQPMFPILNLAVGGHNPSYTGVYSPDAVTAAFPARMYVDWIRLYDNAYTELFLGDAIAETGNFGVFTETTPVNDSLVYGSGSEPGFEYGTNAALYIWNNMVPATPPNASEGTNCWSFDIAGGAWFGMGVFLPNFRNLKNYSDGHLHFDLKTTGTSAMKVGIKSSRGGEFWLPLGVDETSEFGFARDGQWHTLRIPLNRFANTDFRAVHQTFMITGEAGPAMNLSIDNVWWEPSVAKPAPGDGTFGVFTETQSHKTAGEFALGEAGNFFIWNNTLVTATQKPYEGSQSISLQSAPGLTWFGAAFTPNVKHNLTAYSSPNGKLRFSLKTSSSTAFMIGMKSGNIDGIGQKWIPFQAGSDPYGFIRDGQWHTVEIPMSDLAPEVDLIEVSQLFQVLGVSGAIAHLELDDIYFTSGGGLHTNVVSAEILDGVGIGWPTLAGTNYTMQMTANLATNAVWTNLATSMGGNGTTNCLFDPIADSPKKFFRAVSLLDPTPAAPAQILNPGFELAGSHASSATNWTVTRAVGGPVYAIRTNDNPHGGSFNFEVRLASTGAGPVVEFTQAGVPITGGTVYPFTFYANALTGSAGYNAQWRVLWNTGGDTGYRTFKPGTNTYAFVSNSLTAPLTATSATVYFHFAGAAIPSQSATIQLDDITLSSTNGVPGGSGNTNRIQVVITRGKGIRWFASNGVTYQVQWSSAPLGSSTVWNNLGGSMVGNGATNTVFDPVGSPHNFFQVLSIQ